MPRMRVPAGLICFAALAAASSWLAAQSPAALDTVTVVGHWRQSVDAGEPLVMSDPSSWDGTSGPDLDALGRSLFRAPRPAFAANSAPATAFPLVIVRSVEDFSEGRLQVRFKLIGGPTDQTAGLAFGIGPDADYTYVRYNTKDGNVAVWKFAGGKREVLVHGAEHTQLPLDTWHELTVTVEGRRVTGEVNGKLSVTHELPRPVSGRVGFWTKRDATSAFKALRVTHTTKKSR